MKTEKVKGLEERLASVDKQQSRIDGIAKHMAHVEHDAEHDGDEAVVQSDKTFERTERYNPNYGVYEYLRWTSESKTWILDTTTGPVHVFDAMRINFPAALLVAVISVALSIGVGIASGSTPIRGLRTAVWGALVAGLLGSSPYNIVGPANALTGLLSRFSSMWGPDSLPWISVGSGILIALCVRFQAYKYMLFMPKSVFEGFTIAIATTIGLKQINYACGLEGLPIHPSFTEDLTESLANLHNAKAGSLLLFIPMTAALLTLIMAAPNIPWMVLIPFVSIALGYGFRGSETWDLPTLIQEFGVMSGGASAVFDIPSLSGLDKVDSIAQFVMACATIALVAILETLISAKLSCFRNVNNKRGPFREGQELVALSAAQIVCGALAALPPTGVLIRASVNQLNGATHLLSQLMTGAMVFLISVSMMGVFAYLPLPSVASILVVTAIRMLPLAFIRELYCSDKTHFWLCLFTGGVGIVTDPVEGLLAGTLVAYLLAAMRSTEAQGLVVTSVEEIEGAGGRTHYIRLVKIGGYLSFTNAEAIFARGKAGIWGHEDTRFSFAVVDMSGVGEVDCDGVVAVDRLCSFLEKTIADTPGGSPRVMLAGLHASVQEEVRVIAGAFSLTWLHASSVLYVCVADALAAAKEVLDGGGVAAADLESAAAEAEKMKPSEVARRWLLEQEERQQTLSAGPASSATAATRSATSSATAATRSAEVVGEAALPHLSEAGGGAARTFEMHEI